MTLHACTYSWMLTLLLAAQTTSQADRRYFAYQRPLTIAASQQPPTTAADSGQTCAVLDPAVLAHAAPGAQDLRLYNGDLQIPYVLRAGSSPRPRQELAEIVNLGSRAGGVTFDAVMPDAKYSVIEMDIATRNFVTTVDVSGSMSPSGVSATKIGTYTIFDLTSEKLDRSTVLHLPDSNFRFLHFIVHSPVQKQEIGGITIMGGPPASAAYSTISVTDVVKQVGKQSLIVVDISPNVPVDRIQFVPGDTPVNFSRGVAVNWRSQSSIRKNPDNADLPTMEKGLIRRIHSVRNGHLIDDEQLSLDPRYAPAAVPTRMSIAVLNGDDAPLAISAVRLQMRERTLCIDPAPGGRYTLYYGDGELAAPQYDYESLFRPEEHPAIAVVGPEQANPLFERRPDRRPLTERYPALLWIALLAVIAILGYVALRTARRVAS